MAADVRPSRSDAEAVLRRYWKYPGFREGQWDVIESVLAGRDVLAVLPTGGGKSICYQVPALLKTGFTLVVSPLIALMQDQVAGLNARGIPATFINGTLSAREIEQRWTDAEFGRYRLLYVAPERLQTDVFVARAERLPVSLLAVDEAHCISEWGHHFRPSYLHIAEARVRLGNPPTVAVTATATPQVRRDIVEHLALRDPVTLVRGFDRPNIVWSIFRTDNKRAKVLDVIRGVPGSGVIYAPTRRSVEEWAAWLETQGVAVASYHAGMQADRRLAAQEAWLAGTARVIVATNAFGMGIDKPDVRFVVHVGLPSSLEGYYQEAGRGGRDGGRAYAVLLFHAGDESVQRGLIEESHPDAREIRAVYDAVCNLGQVPVGSLPEDPLVFNPDAVARLTGLSPGKISTAVEVLARQETWTVLASRRSVGLIRFSRPPAAIRAYADGLTNPSLAAFVKALLRSVHADAFSGWWEVDLRTLEKRVGLSRERLLRGLAFLEEHGQLSWYAPGGAMRVQLAEPRSQCLPVADLAIRRARRRSEERLDEMLRYARTVTCRRHYLLAYFGEASPERCGACDICLGRHRPVVITPEDEPVMRHILEQVQRGRRREAWFDQPVRTDRDVEGLVDWLIQEGYLRLTTPLDDVFTLTEKGHEFMRQWAPRPS